MDAADVKGPMDDFTVNCRNRECHFFIETDYTKYESLCESLLLAFSTLYFESSQLIHTVSKYTNDVD